MADTELAEEALEVLAGSLVGRLCPLHPVFTEKALGMCFVLIELSLAWLSLE